MKFGNNPEILVPVRHLESRIGLVLEFSTYFLQPKEKLCPFAPLITQFTKAQLLQGEALTKVQSKVRQCTGDIEAFYKSCIPGVDTKSLTAFEFVNMCIYYDCE
jgi:hypothetical protein